MNYTTVICDIKNSTQLPNRADVQYQLIDALKAANSKFADILAAPFIITIGDEWQGLLKDSQAYLQVLEFFRQRLPEIDFYCGIGVGEITIHDFELTVNQLDGPSFNKARKALRVAKSHNYSLVLIQ